ncbi:RNA 2',3'-cyclic phosphodiesterase [Mesoaciditoga sp.]
MRTFMAIKAPEEVSKEISKVQKVLKYEGYHGSWPSASNIHMTLFFFGDISYEKVEKISRIMDEVSKSVSSFQLKVDKVGFFPSHGLPRVVWLGCDEGEEIKGLYEKMRNYLKNAGFDFENRFTPHITVGRIKGVPKMWKKKISEITFKEVNFRCDAVDLYHSKLTPQGAIYTLVHRSELGGFEE